MTAVKLPDLETTIRIDWESEQYSADYFKRIYDEKRRNRHDQSLKEENPDFVMFECISKDCNPDRYSRQNLWKRISSTGMEEPFPMVLIPDIGRHSYDAGLNNQPLQGLLGALALTSDGQSQSRRKFILAGIAAIGFAGWTQYPSQVQQYCAVHDQKVTTARSAYFAETLRKAIPLMKKIAEKNPEDPFKGVIRIGSASKKGVHPDNSEEPRYNFTNLLIDNEARNSALSEYSNYLSRTIEHEYNLGHKPLVNPWLYRINQTTGKYDVHILEPTENKSLLNTEDFKIWRTLPTKK